MPNHPRQRPRMNYALPPARPTPPQTTSTLTATTPFPPRGGGGRPTTAHVVISSRAFASKASTSRAQSRINVPATAANITPFLAPINVAKPFTKRECDLFLALAMDMNVPLVDVPLAVRCYRQVFVWLSEIRLVQYARKFVEEGYDDIETIAQMTFEDLLSIPGMKRGHARRAMTAINLLRKYS